MQKPERIEAGQWWLWPDWSTPIRIEEVDERGSHPRAIHSGGHGDTAFGYLTLYGTYLGNGENPEPSEWMVETCARHVADAVMLRDYESMSGDDKTWMRLSVIAGIAVGRVQEHEAAGVQQFQRALLSLYLILRSLGKW